MGPKRKQSMAAAAEQSDKENTSTRPKRVRSSKNENQTADENMNVNDSKIPRSSNATPFRNQTNLAQPTSTSKSIISHFMILISILEKLNFSVNKRIRG